MIVLNSPMNHPLHSATRPRSVRAGVNNETWSNYCVAWYDANASYVTKDGSDVVSAWANIAPYDGANKDLAQGTAAKQPKWWDGIINGLPIINFDGAAISGDILTGTRPYQGWPLNYYIVGRKRSVQAGRNTLVTSLYQNQFNGSGGVFAFRGTTTTLNLPGTDVPAIIAAHFYPSACWVLCSGLGKSNSVVYNSGLITGDAGLSIGDIPAGAEAGNWDIAEVLVLAGLLPDAIDSALLSYLSSKYAITI